MFELLYSNFGMLSGNNETRMASEKFVPRVKADEEEEEEQELVDPAVEIKVFKNIYRLSASSLSVPPNDLFLSVRMSLTTSVCFLYNLGPML